jgi:hypothetical protein
MAMSETATLRLRDVNQRALTTMAERAGANGSGSSRDEVEILAAEPVEIANKVWEISRRVWADASAWSGFRPWELTSTNLEDTYISRAKPNGRSV